MIKMPNIVKEYQPFDADSYKNLMPQLRNAGFKPLGTADVMRERLGALGNKDLELIAFWLDRYFDTADGIAYNNGKRKIVLDAKPLLEIQPNANLINGALSLKSVDNYKDLEGEESSLKELEKAGLDRRLSKEEVINHPIWLALARGDKHLLREYRDAVFAEIKRRYGGSEGMGVYLGSEQKQPSMRAWVVDDLDGRSDAEGYDSLYDNARLVGVRSKIAEGEAQNLVRAYNPEDVQRARDALEVIGKTTKPELIEPLEALVRKTL